MNAELPFRISLALIGLLLYAIRFYYFSLTARSGERVTHKGTGKIGALAIGSVGILAMIVPILYILSARRIEWASLPMPASLRWIGVSFLLSSTFLISANWFMGFLFLAYFTVAV